MKTKIAAILAIASLAAPLPAADRPADRAEAGDRVVKSFTACRAVADPGERLGCFDRAASALEAAVARKDVAIVDKADIRKTRRSLFGFALPSFSFLGGGKDDAAEEKEFSEINSTVGSAREAANGRVIISLPDGAVWQTTEPLPGAPRAGAKLRIRKGMMGSYFLTVESRSVKAMRIR